MDKYQLEKLVVEFASCIVMWIGKKQGNALVGTLIVTLILRLEELSEIGGFWIDLWDYVASKFDKIYSEEYEQSEHSKKN